MSNVALDGGRLVVVDHRALALSGPLDLLDHRPGGATFEISQLPVFMALFAFGVLVALRWEIVGGAIAAFTAAGLVVFATQQLRPGAARSWSSRSPFPPSCGS